jgi:RhoGEF domain
VCVYSRSCLNLQPVQRVPRYKLLLAELLKHTKETHPDWANITLALEEVGGGAGAPLLVTLSSL